MKGTALLLAALALTALALTAGAFGLFPTVAPAEDAPLPENGREIIIRVAFQGREAMVFLFDNPLSREFASLLPLTLPLEDFAGEEKIARLPRKLATQGGLTDRDARGDFAYYAPWGNVAMFYKGQGKGNGLFILGRILSGREALAALDGTVSARMEVVDRAARP